MSFLCWCLGHQYRPGKYTCERCGALQSDHRLHVVVVWDGRCLVCRNQDHFSWRDARLTLSIAPSYRVKLGTVPPMSDAKIRPPNYVARAIDNFVLSPVTQMKSHRTVWVSIEAETPWGGGVGHFELLLCSLENSNS